MLVCSHEVRGRMTAVQGSRPRRKLLVVGLLAFLLAVLASVAYLNVRSAAGEGDDSYTVMIDIEHDGHCHLILPACSDLSTVTTAWFVGDGSMMMAQAMVLRAADFADADAPLDALVLVPKPPPRSF